MIVSISCPELLTVTDQETGRSFFGGSQSWYADEWHRRAGCGPTCASNVLAYLALAHPGLRALYAYPEMNLADFARHMEEVYKFVTPGFRGLNRVEMYSEGITEFARSRGISLTPHVFAAPSNAKRNRPPVTEFAAFAQAGLAADCPVGFLNLTRGRVKNIQGWHWITVTAADAGENSLIAIASDEGRQISFDLRLWYLTTRMDGGLVYFTH